MGDKSKQILLESMGKMRCWELCSWQREAFIDQKFTHVKVNKTIKGQNQHPILCTFQNLSVI